MKYIFLQSVSLTLLLISCQAQNEGQLRDQINNLYNHIPIDTLKLIESDLDSTIVASDCYKLLYNPDSSKFLAVLVQRIEDPSYSRLNRFGRIVHSQKRSSQNDSIEYLGYLLWGYKYDGSWYYDKDNENEFWDKSDDSARHNFLHFVLDESKYFSRQSKFWKNGGITGRFETIPKDDWIWPEYAGFPTIVASYNVQKDVRRNQILDEELEELTCSIQAQLWDELKSSDSMTFRRRYRSKYSGSNCLVLYNEVRSKVLLPMLYFDNKDQAWLTYYFLEVDSVLALFKWEKIEQKKVNQKWSGKESLEIVDDIGTFIKHWNWGTSNTIRRNDFWKENFDAEDLKYIKKI